MTLAVDLFRSLVQKYDPNATLMFDPKADPFGRSNPGLTELARLYDEIEQQDLMRNIIEMELFGYTIIDPDKVGPPEFIDRLREAILEAARRRLGERPDPGTGFKDPELAAQSSIGLGSALDNLLFEDAVFQEAVMNPAALTIASYLLGYSCVLDNTTAFMKATTASTSTGGFHTDEQVPSPFPPYAQFLNVTWALSDYTFDDGATLVVPGSHKLARAPGTGEEGSERAVPLEAPRGSLLIWHGHTWHSGDNPRKNPGLRFNLICGYKRSYLRTSQAMRSQASQEALDRNPPRFATLMGDWLDYERELRPGAKKDSAYSAAARRWY